MSKNEEGVLCVRCFLPSHAENSPWGWYLLGWLKTGAVVAHGGGMSHAARGLVWWWRSSRREGACVRACELRVWLFTPRATTDGWWLSLTRWWRQFWDRCFSFSSLSTLEIYYTSCSWLIDVDRMVIKIHEYLRGENCKWVLFAKPPVKFAHIHWCIWYHEGGLNRWDKCWVVDGISYY